MPANDATAILCLAYYHIKIILEQQVFTRGHVNDLVVRCACFMTTVIRSQPGPVSSFAHHFTALAVATLLDGLANPEVRRPLQDLSLSLDNGHILGRSPRGGAWGTAILETIHKEMPPTVIDQNGLRHLADAAVGESDTLESGSI